MPQILLSAPVASNKLSQQARTLSRGRLVIVLTASLLGVPAAHAQGPPGGVPVQTNPNPQPAVRYIEKEMWAPVPHSFPRGLDVLEVYADRPGRHPLALLTHGTSNIEQERQHVTPWSQLGQALWFARRGYVAVVIVRKGYGRSGGEPDGRKGGCKPGGSFREAGEASAEDLRGVARWAALLPEVDTSIMVSAGVSSGGFAQAALSADPPKDLKVAISFAGGRGGDGKGSECNLGGVVEAFHDFGAAAAKHGGLPMLWIYAQNDHWFPPSVAIQFEDAYSQAGGSVRFVSAPPDGEDGHHLYSHVEAWSSTVEEFLRNHGLLPLGDEVLPPPAAPDIPPPPGLPTAGLGAWKQFLIFGPYKAFAISPDGVWGSATGAFDQGTADKAAMERCRKTAATAGACQIVARTTNAN